MHVDFLKMALDFDVITLLQKEKGLYSMKGLDQSSASPKVASAARLLK